MTIGKRKNRALSRSAFVSIDYFSTEGEYPLVTGFDSCDVIRNLNSGDYLYLVAPGGDGTIDVSYAMLVVGKSKGKNDSIWYTLALQISGSLRLYNLVTHKSRSTLSCAYRL